MLEGVIIMLIVKYDPEHGETCPDSKMEQFVLTNYERSKVFNYIPHTVNVGSETMVLIVQSLIKEKKLDPERVRFKYKGHTMHCDHEGKFTDAIPMEDYPTFEQKVEDRLR